MRKIQVLIASLVAAFAVNSQAETLDVACFGNAMGYSMHLYFDTEETNLTFAYNSAGIFISTPESSWAQKHSYVTIEKTDYSVRAVGQILAGNMMDPIFESNAEVYLVKDAFGQWILKSAKIYHRDTEYPVNILYDFPCYVQ